MQHFHSEPEPHSVYADAKASPLNTGAPTDTFDATEQRRLQETIEDYLDRVCRPLMDTLPYADAAGVAIRDRAASKRACAGLSGKRIHARTGNRKGARQVRPAAPCCAEMESCGR